MDPMKKLMRLFAVRVVSTLIDVSIDYYKATRHASVRLRHSLTPPTMAYDPSQPPVSSEILLRYVVQPPHTTQSKLNLTARCRQHRTHRT